MEVAVHGSGSVWELGLRNGDLENPCAPNLEWSSAESQRLRGYEWTLAQALGNMKVAVPDSRFQFISNLAFRCSLCISHVLVSDRHLGWYDLSLRPPFKFGLQLYPAMSKMEGFPDSSGG